MGGERGNTDFSVECAALLLCLDDRMECQVGQMLRNKITNQRGRVVRLAEHSGERCYVVFITRDPARRAAMGPESLWREDEVEVVAPVMREAP